MISDYFFLIILILTFQSINSIIIQTPQGYVEGFHVDYGSNTSNLYFGNADIFLGIPYVQAPVGKLRFAPPQRLARFDTSPWNATFYRPACPQIGRCGTTNSDHDEDCLYLNVFTPNANGNLKYPVMVFIHGGSFNSGCAQEYPYKGAVRTLVSQGLVVVTIQYRLGFYGFFTTMTDEFAANRGLLDQIQALHWVQVNIDSFNGDRSKVTIFGESAGAASVSALTYSPIAQTYFDKSIQESGAIFTCLGDLTLSQKQANLLCGTSQRQWDEKDFGDLSKCIAAKKMEDFLKIDTAWNIVLDDYLFPESLEILAKKRPNIPMILGNMRDESSYFTLMMIRMGVLHFENITKELIEENFRKDQIEHLGNKTDKIIDLLEKVYGPANISSNDHARWLKLASDLYTAPEFTSVMIIDAKNSLDNGNKNVFLWEQTYASNVGRLGRLPLGNWDPVPHCSELYLIWLPENEWDRADKAKEIIPYDYEIVKWYSEAWTNFAKFGSPGNFWEPVQLDTMRYYRLDMEIRGGMQMHDRYRNTDDVMWNKVIPALLHQKDDPISKGKSSRNMGSLFSFVSIVLLIMFQ